MFPSPHDLRYFLEVSNTLNVSRAAERLGISQPTLSLALQRLEDLFGTPLLIRTKAGVQLTHAGQKLVDQVRFLLNEWERIRTTTLQDENQIRGRYIIGCHPSVALFSLPHFTRSLLQEYPELEFKFVHDLSRHITEDVISFKIDFGIVVNPWEHPDLIIRPMWKDEVSLWTAKKPSPLQDPHNGKAVLIMDPDLIQCQNILKSLPKTKFQFERQILTSSLETVRSLVTSGAGIGILPGRVARPNTEAEIKPLGKNSPIFHDNICLAYRADAQKSKANRQLAKHIETILIGLA